MTVKPYTPSSKCTNFQSLRRKKISKWQTRQIIIISSSSSSIVVPLNRNGLPKMFVIHWLTAVTKIEALHRGEKSTKDSVRFFQDHRLQTMTRSFLGNEVSRKQSLKICSRYSLPVSLLLPAVTVGKLSREPQRLRYSTK